ncbi:1-acyl-sn-glycerol-3-phosphate acyltransferase [Pelagirhabdus alkalitolerans]|uniref:1-acyl-sn-glycerol-3-phosphate acyltransferase n=1 Tax=Pelagirhabdus alkalitolerans TaxID=1612202 RepID=A0A1G6IIP3_9BACI|nr:lysophospholipid acyltransferase family protein [Pelagirhabdus alkalitolerans]SDC06324.1 1-acyl-sn-glycerol-3-phosphate acyltransferase [Pelagirhabdus alkalitolerans]
MKTLGIYIYATWIVILTIPKLWKVKKIPDDSYSDKARQIYHIPAQVSQKVIIKTKSNVNVRGEENLIDQPVLFVANHQSLFDILLLLGYLDKPIGFIAKAEIKKLPIISSWMKQMKCVFIDRSNRRAALKVIDDSIESLRSGQSIVLFPEGTRNDGQSLKPFKPGSLRVGMRSEVPIIPIAINGTHNMYERNGNKIKPTQLTLSIGKPIYKEEYANLKSQQLASELQERINMMLNNK